MNELDWLRQEIDKWDAELVKAFEKRMEVVLKILAYKRQHGLSIFQEGREQQVLEKVTKILEKDEFKEEVQRLYKEIMKISRQRQSKELFPYNIILIGFMGTGKSTVGKILSTQLEMELLDTDVLIEQKMNMTINKIFQKYGELKFREAEKEVVQEVSQKQNKIISCGGGVVLNRENVEALKGSGTVILLQAEADTIYQRIRGETTRPLLKDRMTKETIKQILQKRSTYYTEAADVIIDTDDKSADEVGKEIISKLLNIKNRDLSKKSSF